MKRLRFPISAAVLSLAIAAGCKKADVSHNDSTSADKEGRASDRLLVDGAPLSREDRDFVMRAAEGNLLEIALGRLAMSRGQSPDVKAFGSRLVNDHSKAYEELKEIAARRGVTVPTELNAADREMVGRMARLSGEKFDRTFAEHMVQDHEQTITEFRRASRESRDPELREWAAKTLPVLESHLAQAKEVRAKVEH